MSNFLDNILLPFLMFLLCGAVIFLLWVMFMYAFSEKISLIKDHWECTASRTEKTFVMSGKVMVPSTRTVCDRYERKK